MSDSETRECELWHAILHRQEPDAGNAAYWFRQAGPHPVVWGAVARGESYFEATSRRGISHWANGIHCAFVHVLRAGSRRKPDPRRSEPRSKSSARSGRSCSTTARGRGESAALLVCAHRRSPRAGVVLWALLSCATSRRRCQFARVRASTITSSVPTNGKVEPIEWAQARAERAGPVEKILMQRGAARRARTLRWCELDASEARADLATAAVAGRAGAGGSRRDRARRPRYGSRATSRATSIARSWIWRARRRITTA